MSVHTSVCDSTMSGDMVGLCRAPVGCALVNFTVHGQLTYLL